MKLKLKLNESELRALRSILWLTVQRNPMADLRQNPSDYLILIEIASAYKKVDAKLSDLEWLATRARIADKVWCLSLSMAEGVALYLVLETLEDYSEADQVALGGQWLPLAV